MPVDAPTSVDSGSWSHTFTDGFNRPLRGKATLEPAEGGPAMTLETDENGTVTANLPPGRYILGARMRTPENYVVYSTEVVVVEGK